MTRGRLGRLGRLKRVLLASTAVVGVLMGGVASAGLKLNETIQCYPSSEFAAGAMGAARNSSDGTQYILCSLQGYPGSSATQLYCAAVDSAGNYCGCSSTDPHLIAVAQSMTSDPYLYFGWDSTSTCTFLRVQEDSYDSPKQP
jgi:hypothetical protein